MTRRADRTSATRTCVGCGQRDAQSALLRLRRDGAGTVAAVVGAGTGRSAYVHARPQCVQGLMRSKGLGRSLRATVAKEVRVELMQALQRHLASKAVTSPAARPGEAAGA